MTNSNRSVITLVEQQKRRTHRYNIYINDEFVFSVHEDILVKHRLLKGEEINTAQVQQIIIDEEKQSAFLQAIKFISRKPRAKKEIERKLLEKGYEQDIIDFAIQKLTDQKYINDEEFASMLTQYRVRSQKKGRIWVKQELNQKGLSKEHVEKAIEQIDENVEYQIAYELAKKKWDRQSGETMEKKRRVGGFLLRRGYTHSLVAQILRELLGDDENESFD